ncbi:hypothetical protein DSL72_005726 [Monilinia vaccinii-corymbosi]|uniref:Uncharacterized protein n=1 Tax=Monilinia vaccinii-corymbosi TaxID=61207 RepID=A0A8A3PG20_9HELO|nr:hypothetical protein DSL72_005726 [Monilinia vaccinii-corymbosi]
MVRATKNDIAICRFSQRKNRTSKDETHGNNFNPPDVHASKEQLNDRIEYGFILGGGKKGSKRTYSIRKYTPHYYNIPLISGTILPEWDVSLTDENNQYKIYVSISYLRYIGLILAIAQGDSGYWL